VKKYPSVLKTLFILALTIIIGVILFMAIPFLVYGEGNTEAVKKAQRQVEELQKQLQINPELNRYYQQAQKQALRQVREFRKKRAQEIQAYNRLLQKQYGINMELSGKASGISTDMNHYLMPDERIYIFMSSSVPMVTWNNYAEDIDKIRDPNIVMVLRGCIGGCERIKPTLEFIQKIVVPKGFSSVDTTREGWEEELKKKARRVQIWIDPLLFRYYRITEVPCIVYAKDVHPMDELSEGLKENLEGKPHYWKVYGDWKLSYMLEKLYEQSNARNVKKIIEALNRSWYSSGGEQQEKTRGSSQSKR